MTPNSQNAQGDTFYGLGIAPALLSILQKLHFITPTPIQKQAIPVAIEGRDLVGIAQTGTGKTLAFGIPMIQRLAQHKGQGLVVLPTRELAVQVDEAFQKVGRNIGLKTALLIGGVSPQPQLKALSQKPHIIIATPGRLIDHLNQGNARLNNITSVVLDEADRMLDMGFAPQIQKIMQAVPKERQTMLFSATMPHEIMNLASKYMKIPVRIEVVPPGTIAERVTQELFMVPNDQKISLLHKILETHQGSTLIFTRTKHGAKNIVRKIRNLGISTAELHSNRSFNQRREALEGFKAGKYRVLVATDIASRGIDVVGIELVLNYDMPSTAEDYVHRIGRTARAGAGGHAITFASITQQSEIRAIERLIKKTLTRSELPQLKSIPTTELLGAQREPRSFQHRRQQGRYDKFKRYARRGARHSSR